MDMYKFVLEYLRLRMEHKKEQTEYFKAIGDEEMCKINALIYHEIKSLYETITKAEEYYNGAGHNKENI